MGLLHLKELKKNKEIYEYLLLQYGLGIKPTLEGTRLRIEIELFTEDDY